MTDNVKDVAVRIANTLGVIVADEKISPPEVVYGAARGMLGFWMGSVPDGMRADAISVLREALIDEIGLLLSEIADGSLPA